VKYDVVGVGTGPKGIWNAMSPKDKALWENGPVIEFVPINTGSAPTDAKWPDGKTSKEKFENLKAEAWWTLRARFERTYEHVNGINSYPTDELISIPNDAALIAELSTPKVEYTDKGKIRIESKKALKARGVKSPDRAESLVLLFCPTNLKRAIWVLG
jgi:phage terminase large subunit